MADRVQFQKKLGELLAVAASQNNKMTSQEVQAFFQDDNLTNEQMMQLSSMSQEELMNS